MKAPKGYEFVIKLIEKLERSKKTIVEEFFAADTAKSIYLKQDLVASQESLKTAQLLLFEVLSIDEIKAIVAEQEIETEYKYLDPKRFDRNVLPKDIYCNHQTWSKDLKLQALMPKKQFY